MNKPKVIAIVGPTAVGKTALSIELGLSLHTELISADSLQVYKKLDIGTAKASLEEQKQIKHHLIDIKEIKEFYDAAQFQTSARMIIKQLEKHQQIPIVVGGTGLYLNALFYDMPLGGTIDEIKLAIYRQKYQPYFDQLDNQKLWEKLNHLDAKAANLIHPNNRKRILRALEVLELTGTSITDQVPKQLLYDVFWIGLTTDRLTLYERINDRVDLMVQQGLIEEAAYVYESMPCHASQGIGYKELFPYFQNQQILNTCIEKIKQNSRRYAKRQLTWFRNQVPHIHWYDINIPAQKQQLNKALLQWIKS